MNTSLEAEKLGLDPVQIRTRNAVTNGYVSVHGWEVGSSGHRETVEQAADVTPGGLARGDRQARREDRGGRSAHAG